MMLYLGLGFLKLTENFVLSCLEMCQWKEIQYNMSHCIDLKEKHDHVSCDHAGIPQNQCSDSSLEI